MFVAFSTPVLAQARDEAPDATPAGPISSVAEELTAKTTEPATIQEDKKDAKRETKPAKKPAAKKEKKKPEKKPVAVQKTEPAPVSAEPVKEARKPSTVPASGKDPVIVINPCSGDVSAELVAPKAKTQVLQPGRELSCLSERQCDALCRAGEAIGEGGNAPRLSPRGDIVYSSDPYTDFDSCVKACGPRCK
jgi:outer membrane biosynthesis protein TonB